MNRIFIPAAAALLLFSCQGSDPGQDTVEKKDSVTVGQEVIIDTANSTPFSKTERSTKAVYEAEGIRVEAYDFDHFEPFLHQQDNYTYVINFWATWCVPCVKELPYFEQLRENYAGQNVHVMLVSIDFSKVVESTLIPFIKKEGLQSEVVLLDDPDANAWIEKVDPDWSGAIPATVIYNASGSSFHEGSFTYAELEAALLAIKEK